MKFKCENPTMVGLAVPAIGGMKIIGSKQTETVEAANESAFDKAKAAGLIVEQVKRGRPPKQEVPVEVQSEVAE